MMLANFMSAVEVTIVATAIPTIVSSLGGFTLFTWVFSAFLLTQGATIPLYGKLSDLYGRKKVFVFGVVLFIAGSTLLIAAISFLLVPLLEAGNVWGITDIKFLGMIFLSVILFLFSIISNTTLF